MSLGEIDSSSVSRCIMCETPWFVRARSSNSSQTIAGIKMNMVWDWDTIHNQFVFISENASREVGEPTAFYKYKCSTLLLVFQSCKCGYTYLCCLSQAVALCSLRDNHIVPYVARLLFHCPYSRLADTTGPKL